MGHALIAYLAAAVAAASHTGARPNGTTAALAARPLHSGVVLRARPNGPRLVKVGPRGRSAVRSCSASSGSAAAGWR
jgi:hypothetical protein